MSRKRCYTIVCILLCLSLLAGCRKGKEPEEGESFICYVNTEDTALVKEKYEMKGENAEEKVQNLLNAMQKEPDSIEYKSVFPEKLKIQDWTLSDKKLEIHFNSTYEKMSAAKEVLLKAAVVQTLSQLSEVEYVCFFIENSPLTDNLGKEVGYMRAEDFVQNTGSLLYSYQVGELKLYFANEQGNALITENISVRYNSNTSIEKLIVEQLLKGPSREGLYPVIPPETKVLGVSVKDNVCYVNLDEGFLNNTYTIDPKITIYAIVNSIVDGGASSQVQILVNGESDITYMGTVDLSKPLSRDQNLVEEKE
ncbi:GerMN domain-containing protein [Bariatricus sp. SGI.161]|uniref:GerMN domain-containing protein n=1 Tax=Lachnospiraceae TaxID=186803 RepID=UPI002A88FBC3|nr:GerMN domain-containing protein [Lachnospiraceae bacterium]MDY4205896.1 GerMN domain-containing protein [Lachnospiraceae bacterium]